MLFKMQGKFMMAGVARSKAVNSPDPDGAHDARVLDIAHLDYHTFGEISLRNELLALFSEQVAQQQQTLKVCSRHDDWLIATHTLKGSARAVGAWTISEIAESLENLAPGDWLSERHAPLARLDEAVSECLSAINGLVASR